jgi:hypothetical protein
MLRLPQGFTVVGHDRLPVSPGRPHRCRTPARPSRTDRRWDR